MDAWHDRMARVLDRKGWPQAELARRSGVDEQNVYKYLQGRVAQPRGDTLPRLARALGVNPLWLRDGVGPELSHVEIVGYVGAGEQFIPAPDATLGELQLDFSETDPIAVIVRGGSMAPVYRPGDYLLCSRKRDGEISACLNKDCVVLTTDGLGYVKKVVRGAEPDRFTLISYNADPIENVELDWCAPIMWVKRA